MKSFIFLFGFLFPQSYLFAQIVEGKVLNRATNEPLIYVNIGVIGIDRGTVSDENGNFKINLNGLLSNAQVRVSMIGYKSEILIVGEFKQGIVITLIEEPILLNEIVVKSSNPNVIQLGAYTVTKKRLTGWGGFGVGAGGERGILIESKKYPILLKDVGFFVARNAYDSVLLRLHVRYLDKELPGKELLPDNIFITVRVESGLSKIDLSNYNLVLNKPFSVSLEWVKSWGKCTGGACFLQFSIKQSGTLFAKEASDGYWRKFEKQSPGIFTNVVTY
jgi:hypothetical protein